MYTALHKIVFRVNSHEHNNEMLRLDLAYCSDLTCLNGGTSIEHTDERNSTTINCVCPPTHTGQRCESKNSFRKEYDKQTCSVYHHYS